MSGSADFDLEERLREVAEFGVGAMILGLRQVNISRRELVEQVPQMAPIIDAVLDRVEELAAPVSEAVGAAVSTIGCTLPGGASGRFDDLGATVAEAGPQLLRLSGLTKRD
ncbi:MAG: hypothetical protein AAF567_21515 [Actinomycetota bacterium]